MRGDQNITTNHVLVAPSPLSLRMLGQLPVGNQSDKLVYRRLRMSPGTHELGDYIRRHREAAGLTLEQLGKRTGVNKSSVHRWENATRTPGAADLARLSRGLGIDFEDLFALAGFVAPIELPTLEPYLRTKYGLSDDAARAEAERFHSRLTRKQRTGGGDAEPAD
jgi:transcriptional regulator with XRE-family HTH domain